MQLKDNSSLKEEKPAVRTWLSVGEICHFLSQKAPLGTAEPWDTVGLLIGDADSKCEAVLVSIDLTLQAVELAEAEGARLIVTHHPCFFPEKESLSQILAGSPIYEAIKRGIAVAAYHSNFDRCALGVIEKTAQELGLTSRGRLFDKQGASFLKLVCFVPKTHLEQVRQAAWQAGAGFLGEYDSCSFSSPGEGTFCPSAQAHPFLGKSQVLEKIPEHRLECLVPQGLESAVEQAVRSVHPYEEVALDWINLKFMQKSRGEHSGIVRGLGYGFWGDFKSPKPFSELLISVRRRFNIDGFRMTGIEPSVVKRLAFVAGKGTAFTDSVSDLGCQVFITGELGYHAALGASRRGMLVMELGHQESEIGFLETIQKWLSELSFNLKVVCAQSPLQKDVMFLSGGSG